MKERMMKKPVKIYSCDLRETCQSLGVSLTASQMLEIALLIDPLGFDYIEVGWVHPDRKTESNFFQQAKKVGLKTPLVVFGSTMAKDCDSAKNDKGLKGLLDAGVKRVTLVGKASIVHVEEALKVGLERNLNMIRESIKFLLENGVEEVFFDAEHIFDGYLVNPEYSLKCLEAARDAGASVLVLCDTNGGMNFIQVGKIVNEVKKKVKHPLGIHAHNDTDMAMANSLSAMWNGATQVQGTCTGKSERVGNCKLFAYISYLQLNLGIKIIESENIKQFKSINQKIYEILEIEPPVDAPYVGEAAFSHKAGYHIVKSELYEHIKPGLVGNIRRLEATDMAGRTLMVKKLKELGITVSDKNHPYLNKVWKAVKKQEDKGKNFEGAHASLEVFLRRQIEGHFKMHFKVLGMRVFDIRDMRSKKNGYKRVEATVEVRVKNEIKLETEYGNGPVNALDKALRKATSCSLRVFH